MIAYGDQRFVRQAELLAISIKLNMPDLPVALVSDVKKLNSKWFDYLIPLNSSFGGGMKQKLYLDKYSPFQETLYIDSDCVVTRAFNEELQEIWKYDFTPVCVTSLDSLGSDPCLDDLKATMETLAISRFPKFNGGVFFFKKNNSGAAVFDKVRELLVRQRELGIRNFDRHGPNDETLYSLALGINGYPLYDDGGRFMWPTCEISGRIHIQPLGGGCKFVCYGKEVRPAICHFVQNNVYRYAYLKCEWILRRKAGQYHRLGEVLQFFISALISLCIGWAKILRYRFWVLPRKNVRNKQT